MVWGGAESAGADTVAAAAAAALRSARNSPRFDRATMSIMYLPRDCHHAGNPWSVVPADVSTLAHSAKC